MRACLVTICLLLAGTQAQATNAARTLCVYDPSGANGDAFNLAKDYRDAAVSWGVTFNLKPYTDERTAVEDFKAHQCQAVLLTGVRARAFNRFSGSVEALGALSNYNQLKTVVTHLAAPAARKLMQQGEYETAGVFPAGAVYLFVKQRSINTVGALAGRRLATLDFDEAARAMVHEVGASMVTADIGTFAPMFNNGSVDACYAPAMAYGPLELKKGLGTQGGVIRFPLSQLTLQVLIRSADMPANFADESRRYSAAQVPRLIKMIQSADDGIPANFWIDIPKADLKRYDDMFTKVRIKLRGDAHVYDKTMLTLLRRVRCKESSDRAECANSAE